MPTGNVVLTVNVLRGRKFPPGVATVRVGASIAGEDKKTAYAYCSTRGTFEWECVLQWIIDSEKLRRASAQGSGNCKVKAESEEGAMLGWVVIDLRSAKLNVQRTSYVGDWIPLGGPKPHSLHENPELFIHYTCQDENQMFMRQGPSSASQSPGKIPKGKQQAQGLASGQENVQDGCEEMRVNERMEVTHNLWETAKESHPYKGGEIGDARPLENVDGLNRPTDPNGGEHRRENINRGKRDLEQLENQHSSEPAILPEGEGPQRMFKMTVDFRSFKAGPKMPLSLASIFVQALLPKDLLKLIQRSNPTFQLGPASLRSKPPVECSRGMEEVLPGGCTVVHFRSGIVSLATVLATEPRIVIDVWHREALRTDTLLGVGSIPLAPLLQETFIDRVAPVYAMMVKTERDGNSLNNQVEVGSIRAVLSIEDLGPPEPPSAPRPLQQPHAQTGRGQEGLTEQETIRREDMQEKNAHPEVAQSGEDHKSLFCEYNGEIEDYQNVSELPEFAAAWEIELWKKEEQQRYLKALQEHEKERMEILENEWHKHEEMREREVGVIRAECTAMELRLKSMVDAVEERERKLVQAEENLTKRKGDLERDYTSKVTEAETAVRRLQAECEHQLEIERDRNEELSRFKQAAEDRLAAAEARGDLLEKNFAQFRRAHLNTSEAQLKWELDSLKSQLKGAQEQNEKLSATKAKYKAQAMQLAKELSELKHTRSKEGNLQMIPVSDPLHISTNALKSITEENAASVKLHRNELAMLRKRLHKLKQASIPSDEQPTSCKNEAVRRSDGGQVAAPGKFRVDGTAIEEPPKIDSERDGESYNSSCRQNDLIKEEDDPRSSPEIRSQAMGSEDPEVKRLLRERQELLGLGVYTKDDDIIQALDSKINQIVTSSSRPIKV